jgi:FdhD protein
MADAVSVFADGSRAAVRRELVPEAPVALEFNGLSYAVMMATPADLADFALGFALTEGLAGSGADLTDLAIAEVEHGWIVRANLAGVGVAQLTERVRARVAESSCGLCGIENLEALAKPLPKVAPHDALTPAAIFAALAALETRQPLQQATGAAHAAAWADLSGAIHCLREDVGRHNAVDKVLGYGFLNGLLPFDRHVLLVSGRSSFEIMQKALAGRIPLVAAVSAPSSLAVEFADDSGMTLVGFLREGRMNVYSQAERVRFT